MALCTCTILYESYALIIIPKASNIAECTKGFKIGSEGIFFEMKKIIQEELQQVWMTWHKIYN